MLRSDLTTGMVATHGDEMLHKAWCGIGEVPYHLATLVYQG